MSFLKSTALGIGRWLAVTIITTGAFIGILWWSINRKPDIPTGSTLIVDLNKPLVEAEMPVPPMLALFGGNGAARVAPVHEIAAGIRSAAADPRIARLVINLDGIQPAGMQTTFELVDAIRTFSASGKRTIAYAANYDRPKYMLANAASERWVDPMGIVDLSGPSFSTPYIGDLLASSGVEVHVAKAGTFKAAVEPYILPSMSAPARAQFTTLLSGFRDSFFANIRTPTAESAIAAKSNTATDPETALRNQLVTRIASPADLDRAITPIWPEDHKRAMDRMIPIETYRRALDAPTCQNSNRRIAVLTLSGPIGMDGDPLTSITPEATIEALRRIQNSGEASVILLRIDSPGGDAQAAEMIRAEIAAIRKSGIPVVASLANTAASGGYWIATAADEILTGEFTMTGSIGAFAIRPSLHTIAKRFHINPQTVNVGPEPLNGGFLNPMTEQQRTRLDSDIHRVYSRFIQLVADARHIPLSDMPSIAEGRVWTGPQAVTLRLADQVTTFDGAVARAAVIGKTTPSCRAAVYPKVSMEQLVNSMARGYSLASAAVPRSLQRVLRLAEGQVEPVATSGRPAVYCLSCKGITQ